ncbi:MAG: RidA family protein [Actinobacteria bacterium]|nr:RidA family protein [Actinomycetota bacterium]MBO0834185.1 RidA family protein [Actinomycetota bacterium]
METSVEISRNGISSPDIGQPYIQVAPIIATTVVRGDTVYVSGVTADGIGDIRAQTARVLQLIDQHLQAAGTEKSKLLTAQVWLADMATFSEHNEAWNEWVDPENPPVRACVQAQLFHPSLLVEIMVTAAR